MYIYTQLCNKSYRAIFRAIYRPISGDLSADISNIARFFAANDMANDFLISYWQQAKKEISNDISTYSADV